MPKVILMLVDSYAVLVMAGRRQIEDVPTAYAYHDTTYNLQELTEIEIAERTIEALT